MMDPCLLMMQSQGPGVKHLWKEWNPSTSILARHEGRRLPSNRSIPCTWYYPTTRHTIDIAQIAHTPSLQERKVTGLLTTTGEPSEERPSHQSQPQTCTNMLGLDTAFYICTNCCSPLQTTSNTRLAGHHTTHTIHTPHHQHPTPSA